MDEIRVLKIEDYPVDIVIEYVISLISQVTRNWPDRPDAAQSIVARMLFDENFGTHYTHDGSLCMALAHHTQRDVHLDGLRQLVDGKTSEVSAAINHYITDVMNVRMVHQKNRKRPCITG